VSYRVRHTKVARDDLLQIFALLLGLDLQAAAQTREAIGKSIVFLQEFPFSCRKAQPDNPFLREMVIPFGAAGYVALFEIEDGKTITVLAIRHQREDDYY